MLPQLLSTNHCDKNTVMASSRDGYVEISQDGGLSWNGISTGVQVYLYDIFALSDTQAWVCGSDPLFGIIYTGFWDGTKFTKMILPAGVTGMMTGIHFRNSLVGLMCGSNFNSYQPLGAVMLKTIDGGKTWALKQSNSKDHFKQVQMVTNTVSYACGDKGTVTKSTDDGDSWVKLVPVTASQLSGLFFFDENNGMVVGQYGASFITNNGGVSWTPLPLLDNPHWNFVHGANGKYCVVGSGGRACLVDSATRVVTKLNLNTPWNLTGVSMHDDLNIVIVGCANVEVGGVTFQTDDGGITWNGQTVVVQPRGSFACSPTFLNFGTVRNGQTKKLFVNISNVGNAVLNVNARSSDMFYLDNNGVLVQNKSVVVNAGQTVPIGITCKSTTNKFNSNKIAFTHDGDNAMFDLSVTVN
jgi:photosystem II stability/assembly factor-like uncharacterized protein